MKATTIQVAWLGSKGRTSAPVRAVTPAPGLAVHRVLIVREGEPREGNAWVVTHVPSGMHLTPAAVTFRTRRAACEAAAFLDSLSLFDWTQDAQAIRSAPDAGARGTLAQGALSDLSADEDRPERLAAAQDRLRREADTFREESAA